MKHVLLASAFAMAAAGANAAPPRVVTDIAPVNALVARVMEGVGAPEVILPAGASPHDHALRPSEARSLSGAEIVIWVGPDLTQWLEGSIGTLAPDAAQLVLSDVAGLRVLPFREGGSFGAHEEGEHHDDDDHSTEDHDDEGHGNEAGEGSADPHFWLDPENGLLWIQAIAVALSQLDPGNAAIYARNAGAGADEIRAEAINVAGLMRDTPRGYLAYHDAFQYAERWLGLVGVGAIQSGHATEPGPARLALLRQAVADAGVSCVLSEPQFNAGLIDAVVGEGRGRVAAIDPLGSAFEPGPSQYLSILRQFAEIPGICD